MTRTPNSEDGSVSTWAVTGAFALVVCAGLAVDLGGQVHAQQRARDVAAQAARAAGQQVVAPAAIQGEALAVDPSAARATAVAYLATASVSGTVAVAGDQITVTVTDVYEPILLGAIGIGSLDVTASSTARLVRSLGGTEQ